mgnify:CR=1 FL=1
MHERDCRSDGRTAKRAPHRLQCSWEEACCRSMRPGDRATGGSMSKGRPDDAARDATASLPPRGRQRTEKRWKSRQLATDPSDGATRFGQGPSTTPTPIEVMKTELWRDGSGHDELWGRFSAWGPFFSARSSPLSASGMRDGNRARNNRQDAARARIRGRFLPLETRVLPSIGASQSSTSLTGSG